MANVTFLTLRYDVRGHLYAESEFGLKKEGEESDDEEEIDKERYLFLSVDELEFEAYLGKSLLT